jgi:hypothetical protein
MKKLLVIFFTIATLVLSGCSSGILGRNSSKSSDSQYFIIVKEGNSKDFPSVKFGQPFDDFFTSPSWTYFKTDDGRDIVEFSGDYMNKEDLVKTSMKFHLDVKSNSFQIVGLDFNDEPQKRLTAMDLLSEIFGEEALKLSKEAAIDLVFNYLLENDEYIAENIEVDEEDNRTYTIHCYDINESGQILTRALFIVVKDSEMVLPMR